MKGSSSPFKPRTTQDFRAWLDGYIEARESADNHVVVLGIDGLSSEAVANVWRPTAFSELRSLHPTSSLPNWLSSLSGQSVADHGVAGVVVDVDEDCPTRPINLLNHIADLQMPRRGTIFLDAKARGFVPTVIENDLYTWRNSTTRAMFLGANIQSGEVYFRGRGCDPSLIVRRLEHNIQRAISQSGNQPSFIWSMVELDVWVHMFGYSRQTKRLLAEVEELALRLTDSGVDVIAHSDHGLVRSEHSSELSRALDDIVKTSKCSVGGAGRVRWLWPAPHRGDRLITQLESEFGSAARIISRDSYFPKGSLAWRRIGEVVVEATGICFPLIDPAHLYEHGSRTSEEVVTPLAVWSPS